MEKVLFFCNKTKDEQDVFVRTEIAGMTVERFDSSAFLEEEIKLSSAEKYLHGETDAMYVWVERLFQEENYVLLAKFLTYFCVTQLHDFKILNANWHKLSDVFGFGSLAIDEKCSPGGNSYMPISLFHSDYWEITSEETWESQLCKSWLQGDLRNTLRLRHFETFPVEKLPFEHFTVRKFMKLVNRLTNQNLKNSFIEEGSKRRFKDSDKHPFLDYLFLTQYYSFRMNPVKVNPPSWTSSLFKGLHPRYRKIMLEIKSLFKFERRSLGLSKDIVELLIKEVFQLYLQELTDKIVKINYYCENINIRSDEYDDLMIDHGYIISSDKRFKYFPCVVGLKFGFLIPPQQSVDEKGYNIWIYIADILLIDQIRRNNAPPQKFEELWNYCNRNGIKLSDIVRLRHPRSLEIIKESGINVLIEYAESLRK